MAVNPLPWFLIRQAANVCRTALTIRRFAYDGLGNTALLSTGSSLRG